MTPATGETPRPSPGGVRDVATAADDRGRAADGTAAPTGRETAENHATRED